MSEFLLFVEENGFVKQGNGYKKHIGDIQLRIILRTEVMVDMYYYTPHSPTYYVYYSLLMNIDGKLSANGMKFNTLQKIVNNIDVIFDEANEARNKYKANITSNINFRNSVKYFGKTPISLDIYPTKIFYINDSNQKFMTVNLEDDLSFEQHDAIPMNDSFL